MRASTNAVHEMLCTVGEELGFRAEREVLVPTKRDAYSPRLDVGWFLPLNPAQRSALESVGTVPLRYSRGLLVAGFEVEGSDASTKTMQADLANLRASEAWFGLLAVRDDTKDNLGERAHRLHETMNAQFGRRRTFVTSLAQLTAATRSSLSAAPTPLASKRTNGSGGETTETASLRLRLRTLGEAAGFCVREDVTVERSVGATASRLDLIWSLPLPIGLGEFFKSLCEGSDPRPSRFAEVPVVAFEIENASSKHAGGGLLNLAHHAYRGVFVPGNPESARAARAILATYSAHYPMGGVSVSP